MNTTKNRGMSLAHCAAMLVLAACGSEPSTGSSSDVSSLEAELGAATQSQSSASSVAAACFETFKSCASVAGADLATCKSDLKACLPTTAPTPSCSGMSSHESDAGVRAGGEPDASQRSRDGMGDHLGMGGGSIGDGGFSHMGRGDAGAAPSDDDDYRDHRAGKGGMGCKGPHLKDGALGACRDAASSSATPSDPAAAQSAHASCMAGVFADKLGELCKKAETLCADPSAPADVCSRVTAACSAFASADAGN